jgi:drug/metabolite transporter (DMT)-like permease
MRAFAASPNRRQGLRPRLRLLRQAKLCQAAQNRALLAQFLAFIQSIINRRNPHVNTASPSSAPRTAQARRAVLCILASAFSFACMSAFVRLAGDLPSVQKSFFRNIVALVVSFVMVVRSGTGLRILPGNGKYLFVRSLAGTVGILANFYALDHLLLSDANLLNKMSPFFAVLFSRWLLKEKLRPLQLFAVCAAFGGSMLVIKPSFAGAAMFPAFIGLLGGAAAGLAYTNVRILGNRGQPGASIVFYFSLFSTVSILPMLLVQAQPMTLQQVLCLLGAGVAATCGQFAVTKAYSLAPAREVSVYDYTQILFSAALGYLLFGQVPDVFSVLGYAVIIAMAVVMFLYNNGLLRRRKL